MRIALAQINSTIGDFSGNREKILDFALRAENKYQADMVLFPELALCGYPPLDLLKENEFMELNRNSLDRIRKRIREHETLKNLALGLGYVKQNPNSYSQKFLNAYGFILGGEIIFEQAKTMFLRRDFFDEERYFEASGALNFFEYKGERIGVAVGGGNVNEFLDQRVTMILVPSAFPFTKGEFRARREKMLDIGQKTGLSVININAVGANDSIIFGGRSAAVAAGLVLEAKSFEEDLALWDSGKTGQDIKTAACNGAFFEAGLSRSGLDDLEDALVLGIRDYMKKCGFRRVHLGLSGGIDSALVACLGAKAAGTENVACFNMPSRFSSRGSKDDAKELAEKLGLLYEVIPIEPLFGAFLSALEEIFENRPFDIAEENLQSRIRGTLLMAYSNKFNSMLLNTGNKSELAMGYCTLYGDTNGALSPLGDVLKTEVFALCKRINERAIAAEGKPLIPEAIISKPPSAELRPNQKDEDSLPPYDVLDKILKLRLEENLTLEEIVKRGFGKDLAAGIIRAIALAEWKRRQTPPVLRVTDYAFGMGNKMPLARVFETGASGL